MADKLKLGYWKIRGLAQPIRFLLEYLAIPYEDKQYTIENHKEWFEQDKQNLNIFLPNLPYVIDGDFTLTESAAIQAYVIRKSGRVDLFGGADIKKSARVY
jgi:glutathione S-transferase